MDPIKGFFAKYHGVGATDRGPVWSQASEASLLTWFADYAAIVRCGWNRTLQREATALERAQARPTYEAIVIELAQRAKRPGVTGEIFAAHLRASMPEIE